MHLVSSSGQHHLISQSAQVAVLHTVSQTGSSSANPYPASTTPTCSGLALPFTATQGIGAVLEFLFVWVQPVSWVPNYLLLSRACAWVFWHWFFFSNCMWRLIWMVCWLLNRSSWKYFKTKKVNANNTANINSNVVDGTWGLKWFVLFCIFIDLFII